MKPLITMSVVKSDFVPKADVKPDRFRTSSPETTSQILATKYQRFVYVIVKCIKNS